MGVASSQAAPQNDQICAALAPIKSDQLAEHIGGSGMSSAGCDW